VRVVFSILFSLLLLTGAAGQTDTIKQKNDTLPDRVYLLQQVKRDGVTMPEIQIKEVTVVGRSSDKTRRVWARRYDRLVYNLKTVYPYSLIVRARLGKVNEDLAGMTTDKERRRYIKNVEKDVFGEYEDDARNMTITQGRLLIKLIDRETQNTSYELIRLYRGGLIAAFWQGVARIFGTNLKEEYDPYGADVVIELILQDIEAGRL
jgi:hypothetical protein